MSVDPRGAITSDASSCDAMSVDALVFDFDGLIVDTETPLYSAWRETFAAFGVEPFTIDEWAVALGRGDDDPNVFDPARRIVEALDVSLDDVQVVRRAHRDELLAAQPVLPGVVDLLDEAEAAGLPVAVASSSPRDWVEPHLRRRGLLDRFVTLSCAGDGVPGKPDPAVYLAACDAMSVDPRRAVAFDDSPNGVAAASAAGLTCVAVPLPMCRTLDYGRADRVVSSLASVSLADLAAGLTARPVPD